MRFSKLTLAAAGLALPVILAGSAGTAPTNYVVNGDFSQGLTAWNDWFPNQTNLTVTPDGVLSIESKVPDSDGMYDSVAQCHSIPSDAHDYLVEADITVPAGQGRTGYVEVVVQSYVGPCEWPSQPQWVGEQTFYGTGSSHTSFQVTPKPGATHFRLKLGVGTTAVLPGQDPADSLEALFDNVSVTAIGYEPPADDPKDPPADDPTPPVDDPTRPADDPTPPAEDPTPPAEDPTPPAEDPTPPAEDPTPPAEDPTPPAKDPAPPADDPTSPAGDPTPPADDPTPMVEPEAPTQPPAPEAPAQPSQPQVEPPAATSTPLPPSAGAGLAPQPGRNLPLLGGLALTALATTTAAFAAAGARMKRR